jgi:hypothetical protein
MLMSAPVMFTIGFTNDPVGDFYLLVLAQEKASAKKYLRKESKTHTTHESLTHQTTKATVV